MSHIAREVNRKESYMESFHNTLSSPFLKGVCLIKKQNQSHLVGHVCATTTLNQIISGGKWGCDKMVSKPDLQSKVWQRGRWVLRGVDYNVSHHSGSEWGRVIYNTLSRSFLESISLIKMQNWGWPMGHVCTINYNLESNNIRWRVGSWQSILILLWVFNKINFLLITLSKVSTQRWSL